MRTFSNPKYPGLQDKLAWYYNEAANKKDLYRKGVSRRLRRRFPGFAKLYRFRNDLSHGVVNACRRCVVARSRISEAPSDCPLIGYRSRGHAQGTTAS